MEQKQKLVDKFKDLLKKEDIDQVKEDIEKIIQDFKDFVTADKKEKLAAFTADGDKPEFFEMPIDEMDKAFEDLNARYQAVLKDKKERKKREEDKNFEIKSELIKELSDLIQNEDVIAEAFKRFNSIQERWNAVGNVPAQKFKDLQNDFRKHVEEFYYHINIYKELKINDLKKNLEKKEDLIKRMEKLREETSIKEIEILHKAYLLEWDQIGPTFKENWEEIKARFYDLSHQLSDKVKSHYKGIREIQKDNLEKKRALIEQLGEFLEQKLESSAEWNKATEQVKEIQTEWKKIGFATKSQNQKIWEEFREVGNKFFERKSGFFKGVKSDQGKVKDVKKELIEKASAISAVDINEESTDWKYLTRQIIDLQKKWKNAGSAGRHDEQKLWKKFRGHCDDFFKKKDEFFNGKGDREKDNLKAKEGIVEELKNWKAGKTKDDSVSQLLEFSNRWNAIGFVPAKSKEKVSKAFAKALDSAYGSLDVSSSERIELAFKGRLDSVLSQNNPVQALQGERRRLNDQKSKVYDQQRQYENNLAFFSNAKSDNPMLKEANAKIEEAKTIIEEIEHKIKLVNIELNRIQKAQEQSEENVEEEGNE